MSEPIKPQDVVAAKLRDVPSEVIDVFNQLIIQNLNGCVSVVYQEDIVDAIVSKMEVQRQTVYDKGWLNVERIYENVGWEVDYDKPAYNETYKATFTFTAL